MKFQSRTKYKYDGLVTKSYEADKNKLKNEIDSKFCFENRNHELFEMVWKSFYSLNCMAE